MVATQGPGWKLAPSLVALIAEMDAAFPHRDHSSDGSIGDTAHASRESDHNPYDGWVHAVDIDEDLDGNQTDSHDLIPFAERLIAARDPRVRYLIYERRICKFYTDSSGHVPYRWYVYTGTNEHLHHMHVSINRTDAARQDRRPWFPPTPTPTPTPEDDDVIQIVNLTNPKVATSGTHTYAVSGVVGRHMERAADIDELVKRFGAVDNRGKGTTSSLLFGLVNGPLATS